MSKIRKPKIKKDDVLRTEKSEALNVCYDLGYLPQTVAKIAKATKSAQITIAMTTARTSGEIGMWSWWEEVFA